MKRAILLLLFLPTSALAFHIAADVVSGVTHCGVVVDAQPKMQIAATGTTAGCSYDASSLAVGNHTITMTAQIVQGGVLVAESVPSAAFPFAVPAAPAAPSGLTLTP